MNLLVGLSGFDFCQASIEGIQIRISRPIDEERSGIGAVKTEKLQLSQAQKNGAGHLTY
jgi:hypothetical protein